jgi:hypothetical protein
VTSVEFDADKKKHLIYLTLWQRFDGKYDALFLPRFIMKSIFRLFSIVRF